MTDKRRKSEIKSSRMEDGIISLSNRLFNPEQRHRPFDNRELELSRLRAEPRCTSVGSVRIENVPLFDVHARAKPSKNLIVGSLIIDSRIAETR